MRARAASTSVRPVTSPPRRANLRDSGGNIISVDGRRGGHLRHHHLRRQPARRGGHPLPQRRRHRLERRDRRHGARRHVRRRHRRRLLRLGQRGRPTCAPSRSRTRSSRATTRPAWSSTRRSRTARRARTRATGLFFLLSEQPHQRRRRGRRHRRAGRLPRPQPREHGARSRTRSPTTRTPASTSRTRSARRRRASTATTSSATGSASATRRRSRSARTIPGRTNKYRLDAIENWWGSPLGPSTDDVAGRGDQVSGNLAGADRLHRDRGHPRHHRPGRLPRLPDPAVPGADAARPVHVDRQPTVDITAPPAGTMLSPYTPVTITADGRRRHRRPRRDVPARRRGPVRRQAGARTR